MQFKNKETGAVIITDSLLSGDWELIDEQMFSSHEEEMTVSEIKQELDELGVEYNPRSKKDELIELLNQSRG